MNRIRYFTLIALLLAPLAFLQADDLDAGFPESIGIHKASQRDAGVAEKFGVLPSISMGWDRESWGVKDGGWATKADYQALLQWTRDELMPSHPADSLGRKIVMLPNWNEFGEGHFLMPSTLTGFGYVDAMREVFAGGGAHEDAVPTDAQKRRFNVLYPRD